LYTISIQIVHNKLAGKDYYTKLIILYNITLVFINVHSDELHLLVLLCAIDKWEELLWLKSH
jgi:hypothetical protein